MAALEVAWSARFVNLVRSGNLHARLGRRSVNERYSEDRHKNRAITVHPAILVEALLPQDCRLRIVLKVVGVEGPRRCSNGSHLDYLVLLRSTVLLVGRLAEKFPASAHGR